MATNLYTLADIMLRPLEEFKKAYKAEAIDVNAQDSFGFTLLHYAVARSRLDIVELLLTEGVNLTLTNDRGQTALNLAIKDDKIIAALTDGKLVQLQPPAADGTIPFEQPQQQQAGGQYRA